MKEFGRRVKSFRLQRGLTRKRLGQLVHERGVAMSHDLLVRLESGRANPRLTLIHALAAALDVDLMVLLGRD